MSEPGLSAFPEIRLDDVTPVDFPKCVFDDLRGDAPHPDLPFRILAVQEFQPRVRAALIKFALVLRIAFINLRKLEVAPSRITPLTGFFMLPRQRHDLIVQLLDPRFTHEGGFGERTDPRVSNIVKSGFPFVLGQMLLGQSEVLGALLGLQLRSRGVVTGAAVEPGSDFVVRFLARLTLQNQGQRRAGLAEFPVDDPVHALGPQHIRSRFAVGHSLLGPRRSPNSRQKRSQRQKECDAVSRKQ